MKSKAYLRMRLNRVLTDQNSVLFATITLVNLGNYALNLILGRWLGPEHFAEVGLLATAVLMVSFLAMGLQLTTAKFVSEAAVGETDSAHTRSITRWFNKVAWIIGGLLFIALATQSEAIRSFLKFKSAGPILVLASGIPLYLSMSVFRGADQGRLRFGRLARSFVVEMVTRGIVTLAALGACFTFDGHAYLSHAVSLGFLLSFAATVVYNFDKGGPIVKLVVPAHFRKRVFQFAAVIGAYELTQILINHSDVVLIKHFFTEFEAGIYTGLALIGRMVYFATWSVVMLLFPKVIQHEKQGLPHLKLFLRAFTIVATVGVAITTLCSVFPGLIVDLMFGSMYADITGLLWLYAIATTLFACANVFVYYYMSLDKFFPAVIAGVFGLLQIGGVWLYHATLGQVVTVQIVLMAALLMTMLLYHFKKNLKNEKAQTGMRVAVSSK